MGATLNATAYGITWAKLAYVTAICLVRIFAFDVASATASGLEHSGRGGYENLTPAQEAEVRARHERLREDTARIRSEVEDRRERARAAVERRAAEVGASTAEQAR